MSPFYVSLDHLQWGVLLLFSIKLNKHSHCDINYLGAYRDECFYKHSLSLSYYMWVSHTQLIVNFSLFNYYLTLIVKNKLNNTYKCYI